MKTDVDTDWRVGDLEGKTWAVYRIKDGSVEGFRTPTGRFRRYRSRRAATQAARVLNNQEARLMTSDPNYMVDGLPSPIRAKITSFAKAAMDLSLATERDAGAQESYDVARYNLERTIKTFLDKT